MKNFVLLLFIGVWITSCSGGGDAGFFPENATTVDDENEALQQPKISSVSITNGYYGLGQTLTFSATWQKKMYITSGTPRLQFNLGGITRYANYITGSDTKVFTFQYTVAPGDNDADGIVIQSPLDLNGATIVDILDSEAILSFTAPATTSVLVDSVAPSLVGVSGPGAGLYPIGTNFDFVAVFDEPIKISTGSPSIQLDIGGVTRYATYVSGANTTNLTFRYTVVSGEIDLNGIENYSPIISGTLSDLANNALAAYSFAPPNTSGVNVDAKVPVILSITPPANSTYGTGTNLNFSVLFDENVTVTGTPRIAITVGSNTRYANYIAGTGTNTLTFRYTVLAGDEDLDGITLLSPIELNSGTILDSTNNPAELTYTSPNTSNIFVDANGPQIVSVTVPADATYGIGQNLDFVLTMSENSIVTGTPRIQINLTTGSVYANYFSGSGTSSLTFRYTVAATQEDLNGITLVTPLQLNGGTLRDGATNNATLTYTLPNTANINVDAVAPNLISVTAPANATYYAGQDVDFTANYSENVNVTGSPRIQLTLTTGTVYANYQSGSGSSSLVFRYTVNPGDEDADGIIIASPIQLNAGTIQDTGNNNASLTYAPPVTSGILIAGNIPSILSITPPADATYKATQNLDFVVNYSGNVIVTGTPRIQITLTSGTVYANYISGSGSSTLTFRYTVSGGQNDNDGITLVSPIELNSGTMKDGGAANVILTFAPPATNNIFVDTTAPSITSIVKVAANGTYTSGQQIDFTVNYDENVIVTGTPRLTVTLDSGTQYADYVSGSGSSALIFRYTVQANDLDTNGIVLSNNISLNGGAIQDAGTNNADLVDVAPSTSAVLIDAVAPTITSIVKVTANGTYVAGQNIDFTVNYDEAVNVTGTPRFTVTLNSGTQYANYQAGTGTTALTFRYTVQVGDFDNNGIVLSNSIALNGGTLLDAAGNAADLTDTAPNTSAILIDAVAPTITSIVKVTADGTYVATQDIDFTVNYDEAVVVTGTPRFSVTLTSGTQYASYLSGTGTTALTFRYTVQAGDVDADGIVLSNSIALNGGTMKDAAGNNADLTDTAPNTAAVLIDAVAPTITSIVKVTANGTYVATNQINFTVNYDENVNVTGTPRFTITLDSGTQYADYVAGSGSSALTFRYTVQTNDLDTNGIVMSNSIALNGGTIKDTAGNDADLTDTAPNTSGILIDAVTPTITNVSTAATSWQKLADTINFTVTFSETVTISNSARIQINITAGGPVYATHTGSTTNTNFTFSYTVGATHEDRDGIALVSPLQIVSGTIRDGAGNDAILTYTLPNTSTLYVDGIVPGAITASFDSTWFNGAAVDVANVSFTNADTDIDYFQAQLVRDSDSAVMVTYENTDSATDHTFNSVGGLTQCVAYRTDLRAYDIAGNVSAVYSTSNTAQWDNTAPTNNGITSDDPDSTASTSPTTYWNAGSDNCGLNRYEIAASTTASAAGIVSTWQDQGTNTSGLVTGLTNNLGTNYYTIIRVVDDSGLTSTVTAGPVWQYVLPPDQITDLDVAATYINEIELSWTAPNDNGSAIVDYVIEYRLNPAGSWSVFPDGVNTDNSIVVTGLTASTTYDFRVKAVNGSGGTYSNVATGTTLVNNPILVGKKAFNLGGATDSTIVSLKDNNQIKLNGSNLVLLNRHGTHNFVSAQNDVIEGTEEFYIAGRIGNTSNCGGSGNIVWMIKDWAGKEFLFDASRNSPNTLVVRAFENATVDVYRNGVIDQSQAVAADTNATFTFPNLDLYEVYSTGLIAAFVYSNTYVDSYPLLPNKVDIVGVPSANAYVQVGGAPTNIDYWYSNSNAPSTTSISNTTLNTLSGTGTQYSGNALRIIGNAPIAAHSNADGDGCQSAPFVPKAMMRKNFAVNVISEWVKFVSDQPVTVTRTNPNLSTSTFTLTRTGSAPEALYHARLTNVQAGTIFEADGRMQVWYEPDTTVGAAIEDETVLFGWDY